MSAARLTCAALWLRLFGRATRLGQNRVLWQAVSGGEALGPAYCKPVAAPGVHTFHCSGVHVYVLPILCKYVMAINFYYQ